MSSKNENDVENITLKSRIINSLIKGFIIIWFTFSLTLLVLSVINYSQEGYRIILILAILCVITMLYFMVMAFIVGF